MLGNDCAENGTKHAPAWIDNLIVRTYAINKLTVNMESMIDRSQSAEQLS